MCDFGGGLGTFINGMLIVVALAVPLAIWKLVDIAWWVISKLF